MAAQRLIGQVHREGDVAPLASRDLAAPAALEIRGVPPAIQEQDRLLAALEGPGHGLDERRAQVAGLR